MQIAARVPLESDSGHAQIYAARVIVAWNSTSFSAPCLMQGAGKEGDERRAIKSFINNRNRSEKEIWAKKA
jgi:hypothetical protein